MGQATSEQLSAIRATRERLDQDLRVLEMRLPETDELKAQARDLGIKLAAGAAGVGVLALLLKKRAATRDHQREIAHQAEILAKALPEARRISDVPLVQREVQRRVIEIVSRDQRNDPLAAIAAVSALVLAGISWWQQREQTEPPRR